MTRLRGFLLPLLLAVLTGWGAAGCGLGSTGPVPAGAPASGFQGQSGGASVRLYFVGRDGLQAVSRPAATAPDPQAALDLLVRGPDEAERARGLTTEVAASEDRLTAGVADGTVDLRLAESVALMRGMGGLGLAQIICTVANADVPGGRQSTEVDVRVYEPRSDDPWMVRCDAAGNVIPRRA
ncbi:hypothetical protein EES43_29715 [Streptomyces sp. ADI96-02]|uniref:GerMN domain-containing protein n=1 Tax=Streptomyces sp. ADI96-02 TaxID=1522760 RepID=UPI000F5500A5|nr:GerMN domain-containing protein [Streptomyces sp. ADI96-02]RPK54048.1 hypothetical protein EES43_29715 [Streptomyces sp. ADI96-02]